MIRNIKNILKKNKVFISVYNQLANNSIKGKKNNVIDNKGCRLNNVKININGQSNRIILNRNSILSNCKINIFGNNNTIFLDSCVIANECNFWCEDEGNTIRIGAGTTIFGNTSFACIEGTSISIGDDCMLSSKIEVRTGDSHSILDVNGNRINPSQNISIGSHVWIGTQAFLLKGSTVSSNSIVGAGAMVTKSFKEEGIIIAGIPAKVIKNNISWDRERTKMKEDKNEIKYNSSSL